MRQKGFTLIELLVVIAVIGLLASVVLVNLKGQREQATLAGGKQFDSQLRSALGAYAVGIWRFEEGSGTTATDESGNRKNGTLVGEVVWRTATECGLGFGGCLLFDGANDYVNMGQVLPAAPSSVFTFSAWVNPGGAGTWRTIIGTDSSLAQIGVGMANTINFGQNGGVGWFETGPVAKVGEWVYIVGVYDGSKASLYVNGKLVSGPTARTFTNPHGVTLLGRYSLGAGEWMNGQVDEVRIYTSSLSVSQIEHLYAQGLPRHQLANSE